MNVTLSVVICSHSDERWDALLAAIESVQSQTLEPCEVIVVVDHNDRLLERLRAQDTGATIIENRHAPGLSGTRNSGTAAARGDVVAFMDDDAVAAPDWLALLAAAYEDDVMGAGGTVTPQWLNAKPKWFPEEFNWVVGCSYVGLPQSSGPVRNFIGCNMSFRREVLEVIEGFRDGMGRVGSLPVGCEETDLCIRVGQHWPQAILLYDPAIQVHHRVPDNRVSWQYFGARCFAEGLSKAKLTHFVGAQDALAAERSYTYGALPRGVARGLADVCLRADVTGLARAAAIVTGLGCTTAGYLRGRLQERFDVSKWKPDLPNAFSRRLTRIRSPLRRSLGPAAASPMKADPDASERGANFQPTLVLQAELSRPLSTVPAVQEAGGTRYKHALSLVRWFGRPIGVVELELGEDGLSRDEYAQRIWDELGAELTRRAPQVDGHTPRFIDSERFCTNGSKPKGVDGAAEAPFVSVVVATRDRTSDLVMCLESLLAVYYPNFEVIVVDNAPSSFETADLILAKYGDLPKLRYVYEGCPGLSNAHNRGLAEVRGPLVAFTDDDVVVDPHWLTNLVAGFAAADDVGCVTGMIFPLELETPSQLWLERYVGLGKGFERRIFDLNGHQPDDCLFPYAAGMFGSGANMAFRTDVLREIGGFDPALGAGSGAFGGDDLAAFFDVITHGHRIVYEPAAIVQHRHQPAYEDLRKQAFGYGAGLTAYLTKTLMDRPSRLLDVAVKARRGVIYGLSKHSSKNQRKPGDYPQELTVLERKGMLLGPWAYLARRWATRRPRFPRISGRDDLLPPARSSSRTGS